jgi:hypothetical protein
MYLHFSFHFLPLLPTFLEARDKSTIPRESDSRRIQFPWAGLLRILPSSSLREPVLRIADRVPTTRFTPCVAHCMTQDCPSCRPRGHCRATFPEHFASWMRKESLRGSSLDCYSSRDIPLEMVMTGQEFQPGNGLIVGPRACK